VTPSFSYVKGVRQRGLWHSAGHQHSGLYLHSFDILSLVVYERIYGRDAELEQLYRDVQAVADEGMKEATAHIPHP
jgi:hypothetical protein